MGCSSSQETRDGKSQSSTSSTTSTHSNVTEHKSKLPKAVEEKAMKLFKLIDKDGSKTIDREETLKFWEKTFPKLNSNELFRNVDKNDDNDIQQEEWIEFWGRVCAKYSEEHVSEELDNLLEGGPWVAFGKVDALGSGGENVKSSKKAGKF